MAALTRISNNQAQSNSIHADKLQRYTLTGDIWANNLVYDSTLTVANLVVYGNSTVINSINTTISDPIIEINAEFTGSPVLDQALLFGRGDQYNTGLVWKEQGGQQFQLVYTTANANANPGTITADSFANLQIYNLIADSVDLIGNLNAYWVNATNYYASGSMFVDVDVDVTGNVNANWVTANNIHSIANVYFDTDAILTGNLYAYAGSFADNVYVSNTVIVPNVYNSADLTVTAGGNVSITSGANAWILGSDSTTQFPYNTLAAPVGLPFNIKVTTADFNDNEINFNYTSLDLYAYNSNANSYSELYLSNDDTTAPYAYLQIQPADPAAGQTWYFDSKGVLSTAGNVIVNGNLTATDFVQVGVTTANGNSLVTDTVYANTGLYSGNVTANNFYTVGPAGNISGADFVISNYYVGNGFLLTGMYSNVNVSEYLPVDQTIIDLWTNAAVQSANIDALWSNAADQSSNIDALWSNAADQSANIDALWYNAAIQSANIDALWDNAAVQSANIDALWYNAAVQSANIDALWSNAADQSANIDALWNNVSALGSNIDALWSNAADQSANIDALWSNAADQSANIDALWYNAAIQSANIDALWNNVATVGSNIDALWSNAAAQSANIDALFANAAGQDLEISNIISGATTLDSVTTNYDISAGGNFFTSNTVTTSNLSVGGEIQLNANSGLLGQYLTSTGSGAYWASHFYNDALPPDTPNYGDIWYDIPDNKLYMWVTDGGSDFWYDFLPPNF